MEKQRLTEAVAQYQLGNDAAFNTIYEESCSNLNIYARSLAGDPQRAEDLLQNTYLQVIKSIGKLQDPGAFLTWSKRIMHSQYVDEIRGSHGETVAASEEALLMFDEVVEEDRDSLPEEHFDRQQVGQIVWEVMDKMPPEQQMVMLAFYRDEMSVAEIAEMMDLPESTIKTRLFYGRKAMKGHIEEYEKRHDIRLHSLIPGPIIGMALQEQLPQGLELTSSQSASLFGKIMAGSSKQYAGAAAASGQASGAAGPAGAASAAGIGGGKIAAIVIAGALVVGGAGFGIYHANANKDAGETTDTQTTQITKIEAESESGTLTEEDYQEMISGGLNKEEVSAALAWETAWMEDSIPDYDTDASDFGVDYETYVSRIDEPDDGDGLLLFLSAAYALSRNYYEDNTIPLGEINRFCAFWHFAPYEANEEYASGVVRTDDNNLYFTPGWGDGPIIESMEITKAEYNGDEMTIRYNISWSDPIMQRTESGPHIATLNKQADGTYAMAGIDKE